MPFAGVPPLNLLRESAGGLTKVRLLWLTIHMPMFCKSRINWLIGPSPSGKAAGFGLAIPRFES